MKKLSLGLAGIVILGIVGFFVLTSPITWSLLHPIRDTANDSPANLNNGRVIFIAGDCATCHATPNQNNPLVLGGGRALDTNFGRFFMPNISSDTSDGIGSWTLEEFTKAVREGVGPSAIMFDGKNLYPAFPYTSYQRLTANDVRDLFAYIKTLPAVKGKSPHHDLKFPFNLRRGVGIWRLFFLDGQPLSSDPQESALIQRGRYLVEGPAHCAECHSPRNILGVIKKNQRYGGGPTPDGKGHFPNISQDDTGIGFWAKNSIVNYLRTGQNPIGKIAGGDMAEVIKNTQQLPFDDLQAIATYLKTLPAVDRPGPGQPEPNRTLRIIMLKQKSVRNVILPTSSSSEIADATNVYVVGTKQFYLHENLSGDEDGKLLATTKIQVLKRIGDKLQGRLSGWQMKGDPSVIYALKGQRIINALLGKNAVKAAKVSKGIVDAETGQTWYPIELTFWTTDKNLNIGLSDLWAYSSNLFSNTCSVCHSLPKQDDYLANQWIGNLNAMRRYTSLTDDQYRLLLAYLQNHSKDVHLGKNVH